MSANETTATAALLSVVEGVLASGGIGKSKGHLDHCPHGQWTSKYLPLRGYPEGSPCSPKCLAAQKAVAMGRAYLDAHGARQLALEAADGKERHRYDCKSMQRVGSTPAGICDCGGTE